MLDGMREGIVDTRTERERELDEISRMQETLRRGEGYGVNLNQPSMRYNPVGLTDSTEAMQRMEQESAERQEAMNRELDRLRTEYLRMFSQSTNEND